MNPQKRTRRARVNRAQGEEQAPTPQRRSRIVKPKKGDGSTTTVTPTPEPRRRRTVTGPATTYTDAAGSQTATPDTEEGMH
ncbi:hypothetical protein [Kitasatospora sp. NPDC051914]|uniref:hypothetical protein n=1 Tax=Kitasatospora sp. NPDC051914 TaxID=3154945 RepID=UPI0034166DAE